jgi:antitoxin StbD
MKGSRICFIDAGEKELDAYSNSNYYANNYPQSEVTSMQTKEYLSATTLSKRTAATLDALEKGDVEKWIILKNNTPKAILMSVDAYEALKEEMEDLRLAALALARLENFKPETALSHDYMMEKFGR